jgi:hypothetical protein
MCSAQSIYCRSISKVVHFVALQRVSMSEEAEARVALELRRDVVALEPEVPTQGGLVLVRALASRTSVSRS